ncbi:hypothetical protein [Nocardia abscessus]|uniref:hypothetical protein n=1 Tax=Nocardia abscessus TaxID=120957 RepID=UPI0002FDDB40|nr:hypothetical protein [Nocardia abscessus]MCC3333522.1 hypothetical protein [Nocardia abscessus]
MNPWGESVSEAIDPERERRVDAIVWRRLGKRFRECTPQEIQQLIAVINAEAAEDHRRALAAERTLAADRAMIDQYNASVTDGVNQAEQWANGGAS